MSSRKKRQNNLASTSEHLSSGKKKGRSKQSKPLQDNEDTTFSPIQRIANLFGQQLSTPELVLAPNNLTLIDKSPPLLPSIPTQKSSVKSEEDSTSNAKNFKPYWNESCKELSNALSWLTKIGLPDLGLTTFNGSVASTGVKSWYSTKQHSVQSENLLKTYLPSFTASVLGSMGLESTSLKCRKIQIYPSPYLDRIWKQWNAACRYVYNEAIAYQKAQCRRGSTPPPNMRANGQIGKFKLRNIIMQSDLPQWVLDTPCHIKQNAIFDAHQAYSASKDCKFRSCRAPQQTIKFNDSNFSGGTWYPRLTKGLTFITSESIPQECNQATQLIKCKGRWFAVFPEPASITPSSSDKVIALDPGVRTFLTGFDGSKFLEFGSGEMGRITRMCQHLDDLMSPSGSRSPTEGNPPAAPSHRIAKCSNRPRRQKMRKAAGRMRTKIQDLVNEVHKQVACYLTQNYRVIFLPTFETSKMVAKAKRKINSKTARAMLTWAHYRFKLFLKQAAVRRGCIVVDVTEEYTSKTCARCGHVHTKLGGAKKFKCPKCHFELPRDFNGAFGILLKALSDTTFTISDDGVAIVALPDDMSCYVA